MRQTLITAAAVASFFATAAAAQPVLGTWESPPDRKGQTGHVVISKCGSAVCGKVVRAFDQKGAPVKTKNVGKRVIWDMTPTGSGAYQGRVYVPLAGRDFKGTLKMAGSSRMVVEGCAGALGCRSQTWVRVK